MNRIRGLLAEFGIWLGRYCAALTRQTASALIATVSNPRDFKNGRQMAAWTGLVPRQKSSGGKQRLGVIVKRGDSYLRGLLTQGARSTLQVALKREPLKRSRLEELISNCTAGSVTTRPSLRSRTNTCESSGPSWLPVSHTIRMHGGGTHRRAAP